MIHILLHSISLVITKWRANNLVISSNAIQNFKRLSSQFLAECHHDRVNESMNGAINILIIEIYFHHPQQGDILESLFIEWIFGLTNSDKHCFKIIQVAEHQTDSLAHEGLTLVPYIEQWSVFLLQCHHFHGHLLKF